MATRLQIANGALIKLGARTISSLAGTDKESRLCNERFDVCRQAVLRMYGWQFASARATLSTLGDVPDFGFSNSFALPADFLRVIEVNEGDEQFRLERGSILSDSSEIRLRYVYDFNEDEFPDPLFCETLSCYLGYDISYALTQSSEVQVRMFELFNKALPVAKNAGATEHGAVQVLAEDYLESRLSRTRFVRDPGT